MVVDETVVLVKVVVVFVVVVVTVVEVRVVVDVMVLVVLEMVVVVFVSVVVVAVVVVVVVVVVEVVVVISAISVGARVSPALSTWVQSSPDLVPGHPDDRQLNPMYKTVPAPYGAVQTPALRSARTLLVRACRYRALAPSTSLAPEYLSIRNAQ